MHQHPQAAAWGARVGERHMPACRVSLPCHAAMPGTPQCIAQVQKTQAYLAQMRTNSNEQAVQRVRT